MKCRPAAFLALSALLASGAAGADDSAEAQASAVKAESLRLIQADLQKAASAPAAKAPAAPADPNLIKLSPFVVTDKAIPAILIPRYETPLQRFLRTGTIFRSYGRKVTTLIHLDLVPSADPTLGSAKKPGPRVQVGIGFSW